MTNKNAEEIIEEAQEYNDSKAQDAKEVFNLFKKNGGTLYKYDEAVDMVSDEFGWEQSRAIDGVIGLIDDIVDPVQLITHPDDRFVGLLDYEEFDGGYGYIEYDDTIGKRRNVVCSRCVEQCKYDSEVTRVVAGVTSKSGEGEEIIPLDADYDALVERLQLHYDREHDVKPEKIDVGASLVSGTTISSNTAFHSGNESDMSFFDGTKITVDAESVDGYDITKNGTGGSNTINFNT